MAASPLAYYLIPMSDRPEWEQHPNFAGMTELLLGVHDSLRTTATALLALVDEEGDDVVERMRELFASFVRTLHHHHHAEEVMLFPLLLEHTGERPRALLDDHETLMDRLDEAETRLLRGERASIEVALRALDVELRTHLAREEELAVPVLLELAPHDAFRVMVGSD